MDLIGGILIHFDPGIGLFGQGEDPAGVGHGPLNDIVQRQPSPIHSGQQERQQCLKTGKTGRRILAVFLGQGVGSVIGGETIYYIQIGPQGVDVLPGCQPWANLAAAGITLRPDELDAITELDSAVRIGADPAKAAFTQM